MSGGVDSSTTAAILCEQGFEVIGATLKLYENPQAKGNSSDCELAQKIAIDLKINHHVLDFSSEFADAVIAKFITEYFDGQTPNPCVYCNKKIKFGKLLDFAISLGCNRMATGHYAKVEYDKISGRYLLKQARDKQKDQSYVLYTLTQDQLSKITFPMGAMTKTTVRTLAKEKGLPNHQKPESQDICFVKGMNYSRFIKNYSGKVSQPGRFLSVDGKDLGGHSGIINYTIGQRKGLGTSFGEPRYVVNKLTDKNVVVLGKNEDLYSNSLVAGSVNFITFDVLKSSINVKAKVRYNQEPISAKVHPITEDQIHVEFSAPQRAITPGQHVVFYEYEFVVGGGIIL
jgi:tRNA-specific 2-thiouridylase